MPAFHRIAVACLLAATAFGQPPITVPHPTNVDFSKGETGQIPPGWEMPPAVLNAGYRAELRHQDCGQRFSSCVAYVPPPVIGTVRAAELAQTFPADPYIGKSIRFGAWLRLQQGADGGYIHIRMRVDYASGRIDMRDSMAPHVTGEDWQQREVVGHVEPDAVSISIWARYVPSGFAWVAAPSFGIIEEANAPAPRSFGVATATFPVAEAVGQTVRYGGWIKTENVSQGYAGLWWRVDEEQPGRVLAFDNSSARFINEMPVSGNGILRGATGTTGWTWYEIELPVAAGAQNINFGLLFDPEPRAASFDALKIELNGVRYANPRFDLDFESPTTRAAGFSFAGDNTGSERYKVSLDATTAFAGRQSHLKMQFASRPRAAGTRSAAHRLRSADARPRSYRSTPSLDPSSMPAHIGADHVNHGSTAVDIYWIDYEGNRVLYRSALAAGAVWRISMLVTHPLACCRVRYGRHEGARYRSSACCACLKRRRLTGGDAVITDK